MKMVFRSCGLKTLPAVVACVVLNAAPLAMANGEALFTRHCASCHGKDGKGQTIIGRKFGAKDLSESKLVEAEIVKLVVEGKKDDRGLAKMPSFKEKLTGDDLKAVINHVLTFRKAP